MRHTPDWVPEGEIDRRVGLLVAIRLHQRLEQWPVDRPVADQCAYARGTGDVGRAALWEYGVDAYTLLPSMSYLDLLALALADEQAPALGEYRRAVDLVADRLAEAANPRLEGWAERLQHLQWAESGLEQMARLPGWTPAPARTETTAALSRLIGRRLADWPYALSVDEQCAYAAALAAEAAELVGDDIDDPTGDYARVVDFLRELARIYASREMRPEPSLSQYRLGATRLAARLLIAAGPGTDQQP